MLKIGDLELHPPVWSRIYVPEGMRLNYEITFVLFWLSRYPEFLVYVPKLFKL